MYRNSPIYIFPKSHNGVKNVPYIESPLSYCSNQRKILSMSNTPELSRIAARSTNRLDSIDPSVCRRIDSNRLDSIDPPVPVIDPSYRKSNPERFTYRHKATWGRRRIDSNRSNRFVNSRFV